MLNREQSQLNNNFSYKPGQIGGLNINPSSELLGGLVNPEFPQYSKMMDNSTSRKPLQILPSTYAPNPNDEHAQRIRHKLD
jgi:hypothetical protein